MAEAIAIVSFVSAAASLVQLGADLIVRIKEFRQNAKNLPAALLHISDQLPLLINTVNSLHEQAETYSLDPKTEAALIPVVRGVTSQINQVHSILVKVMPSAGSSKWKKYVKAVESLNQQGTINELASVIDRYISNLTAYQTARNGVQIKSLVDSFGRIGVPELQANSSRKACFLVPYHTDNDDKFIGRQDIINEIDERLGLKNRAVLAGIGGVGYVNSWL